MTSPHQDVICPLLGEGNILVSPMCKRHSRGDSGETEKLELLGHFYWFMGTIKKKI